MAESAERKPAVKPGWQTTEAHGTALAVILTQMSDALPATWKAVVTAALTIGYALARAIAKRGAGK